MHNGVQPYLIREHKVEIFHRPTLLAMNTNACAHNASEFVEWVLKIDDEIIPPPPKGWKDKQGILFHNWRSDAFDNVRNAWAWAWLTITGERFYGTFEHLQSELKSHALVS